MNVLLVDDDPVVFEVLRAMLAPTTVKLLYASSANECFALLRCGSTPDAILLDLFLDQTFGPDLVSSADSPLHPLRNVIIFISALSEEQAHREHPELEHFYYLEKPFTAERILDVLQTMKNNA